MKYILFFLLSFLILFNNVSFSFAPSPKKPDDDLYLLKNKIIKDYYTAQQHFKNNIDEFKIQTQSNIQSKILEEKFVHLKHFIRNDIHTYFGPSTCMVCHKDYTYVLYNNSQLIGKIKKHKIRIKNHFGKD